LSVIFIISVIGLSFETAHAQTYTNEYLFLDPPPLNVSNGELVVFSGILQYNDGTPIVGETINIKDNLSFASDVTLSTTTTDSNGEYFASWVVTERVNTGGYGRSGNYQIYASHDVYGVYESKSVSDTFSIHISDSSTTPSDNTCTSSYGATFSLDGYPQNVKVGDTVIISGVFHSNNNNCIFVGTTIYLINYASYPFTEIGDPISEYDTVWTKTTTNSDGRFTINWVVEAIKKDWNDTIFLSVLDTNNAVRIKYDTKLDVARYSSLITLDSFPTNVIQGENIIFSGQVYLENANPEGSVVYIKDEDPLNDDDLLSVAYVNGDGSFKATWIANPVDADNSVDVYATYEATPNHYRSSTCDEGVTSDWGGQCLNTIPIYVQPLPLESSPETSLNKKYDFKGDEYIELLTSWDLPEKPFVVITPTPDNYDTAIKYVSATKDGVNLWRDLLESKYGGNWDVDFHVLNITNPSFPKKPDMIIMMVTYDDVSACGTEIAGRSQIPRWQDDDIRPVMLMVCVAFSGYELSNQDVMTTSSHEFYHAMGIGHAWNKPHDLMCSKEGDIYTCGFLGTIVQNDTPSDFDLMAIIKSYGNDGWSNPNPYVIYKSHYTAQEYLDNITPTPVTPTNEIPSWIKNNAAWWAEDAIDDDSFIQGIQFLIKEGIMEISPTTQGSGTGYSEIPSWIKNNAKWWADGSIDESSFISGIEYLVKEGIITIN
jgi:hypothetical protein